MLAHHPLSLENLHGTSMSFNGLSPTGDSNPLVNLEREVARNCV